MKKIFCNFFKNDDGQAFSKIYVCFQNFMLPTATKIDLFCRGALNDHGPCLQVSR